MSTLNSLFKKIRLTYLSELRKEIEVYNRTFEHTLNEALVELGCSTGLPTAYLLHRVDMVSNSHNYTDFTEYHSKNTVYFAPRNITMNSRTHLRLEPFLWQEVDIECGGADFDLQAQSIQRWIYHWINDQHRDDDCPFSLKGCVHGLTLTQNDGEPNRLTVDLGSAKESALIELLHILSNANVETIRVYSRSLYL